MNKNKLKGLGVAQEPLKERDHTTQTVTQEIIRKIKTPLSLIKGRAEKLKEQLQNDQKQNTQGILDQIQRLEDLMGSVEEFVQQKNVQSRKFNLHELLQEVASFFQLRVIQSQIHVLNLIPKDLEIEVDGTELKQILMTLFIDSMESLEGVQQEQKNIFFHFQVSKTHRIISVEHNAHQVALSMSEIWKAVEAQGWNLKIQNREQKGTRVDICIPF